MGYRQTVSALLICGCLLLATSLVAQRTQLAPAWNLFTPEQDAELGQGLAVDVERRLRWSQDTFAQDYVDRLGQDLAANAAGGSYPFEFRIFTDAAVQSIALPGGIIYVSSGLVLATENEHQLAGILAHQMGHVIARHGSQQVSAAYAKRANARLSDVSIPRVLSELNLKADPGSIVLKHNTQAEQEADRIAVQLLYDAGFDLRRW